MGLLRWLASLLNPVEPGYQNEPFRYDPRRLAEMYPGKLQGPPTDTREHYHLDLPDLDPRRPRENSFEYLGAGVSYTLHHHQADQERIAALGLPEIADAESLARQLGLLPARLKWLSFHANEVTSCHYIQFEIPKRGGGRRTISAPRPQMASCQRWILHNVLRRVVTDEAAHGFVPGRSILTGAREHVANDCVINMDLEEFFPSITFPRILGLFRSLGYSPAVSTVLALLCSEAPRKRDQGSSGSRWIATGPRCLPQGACTSPAISNLVARGMDRRFRGLSRKLGWQYTRYADDLTFSGSGDAVARIGYLMHRIRGIAREESFKINESKTRVQRHSQQQRVTGLVVNDVVRVPRQTVRRLRSILHHAAKEGLESQNRDGHDDFEAWLVGMIGHVHSADPIRGTKMLAELNAIRRGHDDK